LDGLEFFFFSLVGTVLETFHGLKIGWYLNVVNETRREMLVLAHTHGTLLSIINLLFAWTLTRYLNPNGIWVRTSSWGLLAALFIMPLGFLSGGFVIYGGDPGPGILLAPLGATFLIGGLFSVCMAIRKNSSV